MKPSLIKTLRAPLLLSAAAVLLIVAGCEKKGPPQMQQRPPPSVTATKSVAKDVPIYIDEIGKCAAPEIVSIQPQVAGRIIEIFFKDGAEVKKGDKLFTIDPRPFQAQLEQAKADLTLNKAGLTQAEASLKQNQAQLEEAQANMAMAKNRQSLNEIEAKRAKNLLDQNAVSKQEFDSKEMAQTVGESQVRAMGASVSVTEAQLNQGVAAIAMAKARIAASEAAIRTSEINLEYTTITSPIDGRCGQRLVDVGNVVQTMNAPTLVVIQRLDPIYADFTIPETELANVRNSMAAAQLKVETQIPDSKSMRVGDLSFLDNAVLEGSGTINLRAVVPNPDRMFWPGQFVNIRLLLGTKKDAVLIPNVATQIAQTGPFVYVVKADSTAELRPVKLGQRHDDQVVINEGVAGNEDVIVTGQMMLYPGVKVAVQSGAAVVAAPAPDGKGKAAEIKVAKDGDAAESSDPNPNSKGGDAKK